MESALGEHADFILPSRRSFADEVDARAGLRPDDSADRAADGLEGLGLRRVRV